MREAVRALSLVRILDVRQGDGTYVSDLSAESLVDTLSFIVEFQHDSSVLELLEVRRILEPAASRLARPPRSLLMHWPSSKKFSIS